jgi:hypothetical protein
MDTDLFEYVSENAGGIFADLVFAVVWITVVTVLVGAAQGPDWALYLLMLAGIPAYYGFFASLRMAGDSAD